MAANKSDTRSVEQIEREIQETRAQMGHTVDVLREKTSPARIRDKTYRQMRSRSNQMATSLSQTVQRNPLLYGMAGAVLVWWMFSGKSHRSEQGSRRAPVRISG